MPFLDTPRYLLPRLLRIFKSSALFLDLMTNYPVPSRPSTKLLSPFFVGMLCFSLQISSSLSFAITSSFCTNLPVAVGVSAGGASAGVSLTVGWLASHVYSNGFWWSTTLSWFMVTSLSWQLVSSGIATFFFFVSAIWRLIGQKSTVDVTLLALICDLSCFCRNFSSLPRRFENKWDLIDVVEGSSYVCMKGYWVLSALR